MSVVPLSTHHYERASLVERLRVALDAPNLRDKRLSAIDLAPLDQFHARGLAATVELADALAIDSDTRVLDIGSGLGGPSRYLATTYNCKVRGIDLSKSFVAAATFLADRCGLSDRVSYQHGNALALPHPDASFDIAWTQHVAMNIADRVTLYSEASRVLRQGGQLAIYDVVATPGSPALRFPVPWAAGPEMSFLVTSDHMRKLLYDAGFQALSWLDRTEEGLLALAQSNRRTQPLPATSLDLRLVMGPDFGVMAANLASNLREGRVALLQAIVEKR